MNEYKGALLEALSESEMDAVGAGRRTIATISSVGSTSLISLPNISINVDTNVVTAVQNNIAVLSVAVKQINNIFASL